MLDAAKLLWRRMLRVLREPIRRGVPVVGLEPSCVAAFRDELPNLVLQDEDVKRLTMQTLTRSEFLQQQAPDWDVPKLARGPPATRC